MSMEGKKSCWRKLSTCMRYLIVVWHFITMLHPITMWHPFMLICEYHYHYSNNGKIAHKITTRLTHNATPFHNVIDATSYPNDMTNFLSRCKSFLTQSQHGSLGPCNFAKSTSVHSSNWIICAVPAFPFIAWHSQEFNGSMDSWQRRGWGNHSWIHPESPLAWLVFTWRVPPKHS